MLMIFTYSYLMLAGVTLMFASVGTFNLPPLFDHHYVNIFMFVMGFCTGAFGYIGAWRHK